MGQPSIPVRKKSATVADEPRAAAPVTSYAATLDSLAASIGLPGQTLDALSRKGKGPPIFKIGRRIYCRLRDFHQWLDDLATGKIDATLHPAKRRRLGLVRDSGDSANPSA
jgi:hypothetical protein